MADPVIYSGVHGYALIGKETTYGTAVSCTKDIGRIQSLTVREENNTKRIHSISQRNADTIVHGNYAATIDAEISYNVGRIFEYTIGTVAHDAAGTPDIKHTYSEADALPSFTLEDGFNSTTDVTMTYAGCRVNSLTVTLNTEGEVSLRAEIFAKTVSTGTTGQSAVISTDAPLSGFSGSVATGAAGSESSLSYIQDVEFTIRNNLEKLYSLGSRTVDYMQGNEREYEFSFTKVLESKTEYERFLGSSSPQTTATIPSVVIDISNAVAVAQGRKQIYLKLANCSYSEVETPTAIKGYVLQKFTGFAESISSCYSYDSIASASW